MFNWKFWKTSKEVKIGPLKDEDKEDSNFVQMQDVDNDPWPKPLMAWVKFHVFDMFGMDEDSLVRRLLVNSLGESDFGKVNVEKFEFSLIGVTTYNEVIWEIRGELHPSDAKTKKDVQKKEIKKKSTSKKSTTKKTLPKSKKTTKKKTSSTKTKKRNKK